MTEAEKRYCGEAGTAYWERNTPRLVQERWARARAWRALIPDAPQHPALEVGCGRGVNLVAGDVGLDCDGRQLRFLPAGVIGVIGSATELPCIDDAFPVVLSIGCLMHLPARPQHWGDMDFVGDESWQRAVAEMARVSSRYVVLGEYWAEAEEPVTGKHWDGVLWRRPYTVPGFSLLRTVQPVPPFDGDLNFTVWGKRG